MAKIPMNVKDGCADGDEDRGTISRNVAKGILKVAAMMMME